MAVMAAAAEFRQRTVGPPHLKHTYKSILVVRLQEREHEREARRGYPGKREHDRGGPHPQVTNTEGRARQKTHHRRGEPHRGPTQNSHRQFGIPQNPEGI